LILLDTPPIICEVSELQIQLPEAEIIDECVDEVIIFCFPARIEELTTQHVEL